MTSVRETVLQALASKLRTLPDIEILRNEPFPVEIPEKGIIVLLDGDPGEPEVILSPLRYLFTHRAVLEVGVRVGDGDARDVALDTLLQNIASLLSADTTLGGLCDHVEPLAPDTNTDGLEGASPIKGAVIGIELTYETASQLG